MTENYVVKNKIRLQLRKTRQRVIKNIKRDISKYEDSKEKNIELLEQVKKAEIETVLHIVLMKFFDDQKPVSEMTVSEKPEEPESSENSDPKSVGKSDSQDLPKIDFSNGEHKIATVFLNSEQKSLLEGINNNLESFRENRKPKKVKSKIDKKHPDNETKSDVSVL